MVGDHILTLHFQVVRGPLQPVPQSLGRWEVGAWLRRSLGAATEKPSANACSWCLIRASSGSPNTSCSVPGGRQPASLEPHCKPNMSPTPANPFIASLLGHSKPWLAFGKLPGAASLQWDCVFPSFVGDVPMCDLQVKPICCFAFQKDIPQILRKQTHT